MLDIPSTLSICMSSYLFPMTLSTESSFSCPTSWGSSVRLLARSERILRRASCPSSGGREKRLFSSRFRFSRACRQPIPAGSSCTYMYVLMNDIAHVLYKYIYTCIQCTDILASVPGLPRYVRVLICGGGDNAVKTGKAWAD